MATQEKSAERERLLDLESALVERRKVYGLDDVEYAIALEACAEAGLAAGELELALDRIGEAVGILFENKHARIARAIALEAEVLVAARHPIAPFSELGPLPNEVVEEIAFAALERARTAKAEAALGILTGLRALLLERLGESHPATVRVLAGIANTQRELGDHAGRRDALNALIASFDCIGALPQVVETLLQRGLAESQLGHDEVAQATHEEAVALSRELGEHELSSRALRMLAMVLFDRGEAGGAEEVLDRARKEAEAGGDPQITARADAALAVVLRAKGDAEKAKAALDRAAAVLPEEDPDITWAKGTASRLAETELAAAHRRAAPKS